MGPHPSDLPMGQPWDLLVTGVPLTPHAAPTLIPAGTSKSAAALLSITEWKELLKGLGLIGLDITERDARLCFACSRMAVIDGTTTRGMAKENNLPFEGFLEALCRLSMLKSLPTDAELQQYDCSDAGICTPRRSPHICELSAAFSSPHTAARHTPHRKPHLRTTPPFRVPPRHQSSHPLEHVACARRAVMQRLLAGNLPEKFLDSLTEGTAGQVTHNIT
jgi:hypothetical protein